MPSPLRLLGGALALAIATAAPAHGSVQNGGTRIPTDAVTAILGGDYGEEVGIRVAGPGDIDGDAKPDVLVTATAVRMPGQQPQDGTGAGYLVRGGVGGIVPASGGAILAAHGYAIGPTTGATLYPYSAMSPVGDVNGDGLRDIAIGVSVGNTERVQVIFGRANPVFSPLLVADPLAPDLGYTIYGASRPRGVGDMNGDGRADIAVYGPTSQLVLYSPATPGTVDLATGTPDGFRLNYEIVTGIGDFNGDGFGDLVARSQYRAFVIYGSAASPGVVSASDDMPALRGFAIKLAPGVYGIQSNAPTSLGDTNGDGRPDLLITAPEELGKAWIVRGGQLSGLIELQGSGNTDRAVMLTGRDLGPGYTGFGASSAAIGDVDGDGRGDVALGTWRGKDGPGSALVYVLRSSAFDGGEVPALDAQGRIDPAKGFVISGGTQSGTSGYTLAHIQPGLLAVGTPTGSGGQSGAVYLMRTRPPRVLASALSVLKLAAALSTKAFVPRSASGEGGARLRVGTATSAAVRTLVYRRLAGRLCFRLDALAPAAQTCIPKLHFVGLGPGAPAREGARTIGFSGRVAGKALAAGQYVLVLQARKGSRVSPLTTLPFTVRG